MEQEQYQDIQNQEQIVQAIEQVNTNVAALSGSEAALLAAMQDSNDMLVGFDDRLMDLRSVIDTNLGTVFDAIMEMKSENSGNGLANAIATGTQPILEVLNAIKDNTGVVSDNVQASKDRKDDTSFLNAALAMINVIADKKKAKDFHKNSGLFAEGMKLILEPIEKFVNGINDLKLATETITASSDLLTSVADTIKSVGKSIGIIALSLGAMMAVLIFLDWGQILKFTAAFPLVCGAMALGLFMLNKAADDKTLEGVRNFAWSILILSGAVLVLMHIDIQRGLIALGGVTLLAAGLALTMRILTTKDAKKHLMDFNKGILQFAAGIAIMALTMIVIGEIVKDKSWAGFGAAVAYLLVAGAAMWLASKFIGQGAKDIGKSMLWLAASVGVFALSVYLLDLVIHAVDWPTWLAAAGILTALTVSVVMIGKNGDEAKQGAEAMIIVAASIIVVAIAARLLQGSGWEDLAKVGAVLVALVASVKIAGKGGADVLKGALAIAACSASLVILAFALKLWPEEFGFKQVLILDALLISLGVAAGVLGALGATALIGAAVVAALGVAMLSLSFGLSKWPENINLKTIAIIDAAIVMLCAGMALIGNPFTLPFILMGIAESAALGLAIASLGKGLQEAEKVDFKKAVKAADAMVDWSAKAVKKLGTFKLHSALDSIEPLKVFGDALTNIATGIEKMAQGTWEEYEVVHGERRLKAVHQIGPEQYAAFGKAVGDIVDAITVPLQNFGKGGGFLRDSDAENGIEALEGIDNIINPMIAVATAGDAIKEADYGGFAVGMSNLIDGISGPLSEIGKGGGLFGDPDVENGVEALQGIENIINPIVELAKNQEDLGKVDFKATAGVISDFYMKLGPMLEKAGDWDDVDDACENFEDIGAASGAMIDTLKMAKEFAEFDATQQAAFMSTMQSITDGMLSYANAENSLPMVPRFSKDVTMLTTAFNGLKTENLDLLVRAGEAVDSVANANLSKIKKGNSELSKQLFKRLDNIDNKLKSINKNTKPREVAKSQVKLDPNTNRVKNEFRLEDANEVDLVTIAIQLENIYGLIAARGGI